MFRFCSLKQPRKRLSSWTKGLNFKSIYGIFDTGNWLRCVVTYFEVTSHLPAAPPRCPPLSFLLLFGSQWWTQGSRLLPSARWVGIICYPAFSWTRSSAAFVTVGLARVHLSSERRRSSETPSCSGHAEVFGDVWTVSRKESAACGSTSSSASLL